MLISISNYCTRNQANVWRGLEAQSLIRKERHILPGSQNHGAGNCALKPDASLRTASVGRPHRPYPSWGRPQGRDSEPSPGTDRYLNERKCHFYSARFSANRFSATLTKKEH